MLKDIRIQGTFGHRDSYFNFEEGLTSITGRNGRGKSMIQEMVQFAYWGIAALRGVSSDYPELKVVLRSWIKNQPYTIERTITKAGLFAGHGDDKKQIATGTKAVNIAVKELFGYSMAVFQVANAINQKKVDEFCAMLPTARKKLVDETIGLSALDDLGKWIGENELGVRSKIQARTELLREPVKPTEPEGYAPTGEIEAKLVPLLRLQSSRFVLEAQANQVLVAPMLVELDPDDALLDELRAQVLQYNALVVEATLLQKDIDAIGPVPAIVEAKLEEDDAKLDEYRDNAMQRANLTSRKTVLVAQWQRIPESAYTLEQLKEMAETWRKIEKFNERAGLLARGISYHCEKCAHDGKMVDPRVHSAEFAGIPEEVPASPELTRASIEKAHSILEAQPRRAELDKEIREIEEAFLKVPDTAQRVGIIEAKRRDVAAQQYALQKKARMDELLVKRADLGNRLVACPNKQPYVIRIESQRQRYALYQQALSNYTEQEAKVDAAKLELTKFSPTLDADIRALQSLREAGLIFETHMVHYEKAHTEFLTLQFEIGMFTNELEDWGNVKLAVTDLRARIKGYLLPSLNKVASYLVNEFSGGELGWIVINDDFEVIVDGKRVETLSGGQKTITNLAIRIGLGQVLTNAVFPVLMMDEPDESCDDVVAGLIEKTMQVLKTKMKQILVVTHKTGAMADNRIHLE
jgi:DNA repair exonuclease SbcCD ATPase subunit